MIQIRPVVYMFTVKLKECFLSHQTNVTPCKKSKARIEKIYTRKYCILCFSALGESC